MELGYPTIFPLFITFEIQEEIVKPTKEKSVISRVSMCYDVWDKFVTASSRRLRKRWNIKGLV